MLAANPMAPIDQYRPLADQRFRSIMADVETRLSALGWAILWLAKRDIGGFTIRKVLRKAGWVVLDEIHESAEYAIMDKLLKMPEGGEKEAKLAQAKKEAPRFVDWCVNDLFCGV